MTKRRFTKRILVYETIGFLIVIIVLWLDEIFDLPHYLFGAPATPINWIESIFETILVLILGICVISISQRALKRIKHLEGFLRVCSFCKRIKVGDDWIPIEEYIKEHSAAEFSHGLCSECLEKQYGKFLSKN
jgi:hypothetical protein